MWISDARRTNHGRSAVFEPSHAIYTAFFFVVKYFTTQVTIPDYCIDVTLIRRTVIKRISYHFTSRFAFLAQI